MRGPVLLMVAAGRGVGTGAGGRAETARAVGEQVGQWKQERLEGRRHNCYQLSGDGSGRNRPGVELRL